MVPKTPTIHGGCTSSGFSRSPAHGRAFPNTSQWCNRERWLRTPVSRTNKNILPECQRRRGTLPPSPSCVVAWNLAGHCWQRWFFGSWFKYYFQFMVFTSSERNLFAFSRLQAIFSSLGRSYIHFWWNLILFSGGPTRPLGISTNGSCLYGRFLGSFKRHQV